MADRTLGAAHAAAPRAVGTPSAFSRAAIARNDWPASCRPAIRSATAGSAAGRPRRRFCFRSSACFSLADIANNAGVATLSPVSEFTRKLPELWIFNDCSADQRRVDLHLDIRAKLTSALPEQ